VLLPETATDGAATIAERIRAKCGDFRRLARCAGIHSRQRRKWQPFEQTTRCRPCWQLPTRLSTMQSAADADRRRLRHRARSAVRRDRVRAAEQPRPIAESNSLQKRTDGLREGERNVPTTDPDSTVGRKRRRSSAAAMECDRALREIRVAHSNEIASVHYLHGRRGEVRRQDAGLALAEHVWPSQIEDVTAKM